MPDNLRLQVVVEVDAQTGELKIVEQGLEGVRQETDRATDSTQRNTRAVGEQQRRMKSFREELAGVAAAAAALYGVLRGGQAVIENTALFEQFELRLNVFAATAQEAQRNYDELLTYAARTPFALQGVIDSFLLLEATSFEPRLDELRALGDIAAASARPLEELGQAVAASGRGEFDPIEGFGFTIKKENEGVRIQFRDTVKLVEDSRRAILTAIVEIARERDEFAGATEILAASLTGALSNLGDSFQQFLVNIGQGGLADATGDWARLLSAVADNAEGVARALGFVAGVGVRVAPVAGIIGAIYLQSRLLHLALPRLNAALAVTGTRLLSVAAAGTAVRTVFGGWPGLFLLVGEAALLFGSQMVAAGEDASLLKGRIDEVTGSIRANIDAYEAARAQREGEDAGGIGGLLRDIFTTSDDELRQSGSIPDAARLSERLRQDIDVLYEQLADQQERLQSGLDAGLDTTDLQSEFESTRRAVTDLIAEYETLLRRIAASGERDFRTDYAADAADRQAEVAILRAQVANVSGTPGVAGTLDYDREALAAVLNKIADQELGLMSDFEQAVTKIRAEAQQLRDDLAAAGTDAPYYDDYLARIDAIAEERIGRLRQARREEADAAGDVIIADLEAFEQELREMAAANDARLRDAINQIVEAGGDGFDKARKAAVDWESEMLGILAESPAAWDQWAETVVGITDQKLKELNEQVAEAVEPPDPDTWLDGIEGGLQRYLALVADVNGQASEAVLRSFKSMEDALVEFVTTGELNIRNLVDTIIAEFARIVIRQAILGPLAAGLSGALGSVFGGGGAGTAFGPAVPGSGQGIALAPVFGVGHTGAVVPNWPEYRAVDPALLAGAERYHSGYGLRPGESLGIFEAGEVILSRDQVAALRGSGAGAGAGTPPEVRLNFENRGNPVEPEVQSQRWDGRTLVIDVMLEDMARRGPFSQGLRRTFGLREQSV